MSEEARTSVSFGKVMKYNHGPDWEAYTKQLDFYLLTNGVLMTTPKDANVMYAVIVGPLIKKHEAGEIGISSSM